MTTTNILPGIDLGKGERGEQRRAALEQMAHEGGYIHGFKSSIGRMIVALADEQIAKTEKMRTVWAHDGSAVKIYGQHSPHPIIAESAAVEHFGDVETTFHQLHRMRRENWLPRPSASERHPFGMRDIELADENERRQCRHWTWGTHYPSANEYVFGYHYHENGFAIFAGDIRVKVAQ